MSKEIGVKLIANTSQFKSDMAGINREMRLVKTEMQASANETDKFGNKIKNNEGKVKQLSQQMKIHRDTVKRLAEAHRDSAEKTGKNSRETQQLATRLAKAKGEMNKTEGQLKRTKAEMDKMAESTKKAKMTYAEFDQQFRQVGGTMRNVGTSVGIVSGAMLAGLVKPMIDATKVASNFEYGMSGVKAISGATGDEFLKLKNKAKEMGAGTSFSATEAAKGLEYMALAGWDTNQMLTGIKPVLRLAEAGNIDLGRSSDLVTDSMSAMGIQVKDLDGYLDKVARTSQRSNTNIDALMEANVIAGGSFKNLNVPLAESNALLGILANRGFKGSQSGTAMNTIMANLTSNTGEAGKALKEMGVQVYDSDGKFRGLETVLKDVRDKTLKMTDAEKANYITRIAGKQHLKTFQALISGLGEEYDGLKKEIVESDGALEDMASTMKDNAQGKIEGMKSAIEGLQIEMGERLLPHLSDGATLVTDLINKFEGMDGATKDTIVQTALLSAGILGLTTVVAGLVAGVGALMAFVGPIGLAIVGGTALIGALGIAIYGTTKYLENSNKATSEHAKELSGQATSLEESKNAFDRLTEKAKISNDELARMSDLNQRIKQTSNADELRVLKDEYNMLAEKSGLSKDEIKKLFAANDEIIKQTPNVKKSISEQGNEFAKNTDEVEKLIQKLREKSETELELQRAKLVDEEKETLKEIKQIKSDILMNEERTNFYLENRNLTFDEAYKKLEALEKKRVEEKLTTKELDELNQQLTDLALIRDGRQGKLNDKIQKEADTLDKNLEKREKEVDKLTAIEQQLVNVKLQNVGIKEEGQEGLTVLNEQIEKNDVKLRQLTDEQVKNGSLTEEQQKQYDKLVNKTSEMEKARDAIYEEYDLMGSVNSLVDSQVKNLSNGTQERVKALEKTHGIKLAEGEIFTQLQNKNAEYVKERQQLEENRQKQGANKAEIDKQIKALDEKILKGDGVSAQILDELGLLDQVNGKIKLNSSQLQAHLEKLGYTTEEAKRIASQLVKDTTVELKKGTEEAGQAGTDKGKSFSKGVESTKTDVIRTTSDIIRDLKTNFNKGKPESHKAGEDKGVNFNTGVGSTKSGIMRTTDDIIRDLKTNFNKGDSSVKKSGENKGTAHETGINSTYGKNMTASLGISTGVTRNLGGTTDGGGGSQAGNMFRGGLISWIQRVNSSGEKVASSGVRGLKSVSTSGAGSNFVEGFRRSIAGGSVWSAAWSLGKSALSALNKSIRTASPSRETAITGGFFTEGFALGIEDEKKEAIKNATSLGSETHNALQNQVRKLAHNFSNAAYTIRANKEVLKVEHEINNSSLETEIKDLKDAFKETTNVLSSLFSGQQQQIQSVSNRPIQVDVTIDSDQITNRINERNAINSSTNYFD